MSEMMTKRAKLLEKAARECEIHADGSLERGAWNMAIRRAQEAVELELKSVMSLLGVDYPKDHDQAGMMLRILKARGVELNPNVTSEIERISTDLSRKRGPALQQDEGYDAETAKRAIANMKYVLMEAGTIRKLI